MTLLRRRVEFVVGFLVLDAKIYPHKKGWILYYGDFGMRKGVFELPWQIFHPMNFLRGHFLGHTVFLWGGGWKIFLQSCGAPSHTSVKSCWEKKSHGETVCRVWASIKISCPTSAKRTMTSKVTLELPPKMLLREGILPADALLFNFASKFWRIFPPTHFPARWIFAQKFCPPNTQGSGISWHHQSGLMVGFLGGSQWSCAWKLPSQWGAGLHWGRPVGGGNCW